MRTTANEARAANLAAAAPQRAAARRLRAAAVVEEHRFFTDVMQMSHKEIAHRLGIRPDSLTRALKRHHRKGAS